MAKTKIDLYIEAKSVKDKKTKAALLAKALGQPESVCKLQKHIDHCFGNGIIADAIKDMIALQQIKDRRSKK